jgi:hypothetical protein
LLGKTSVVFVAGIYLDFNHSKSHFKAISGASQLSAYGVRKQGEREINQATEKPLQTETCIEEPVVIDIFQGHTSKGKRLCKGGQNSFEGAGEPLHSFSKRTSQLDEKGHRDRKDKARFFRF